MGLRIGNKDHITIWDIKKDELWSKDGQGTKVGDCVQE